MKLLTATTETQGQRDSDFTWCVPGEVVTASSFICDTDGDDPDGGCGCGRAFSGLNSHRATTTAVVKDVDGYTFEDLAVAVWAHLQHSGWAAIGLTTTDAVRLAAEIAETADGYDEGTVLETRLGELAPRAAS
jgi:hypothetical protein